MAVFDLTRGWAKLIKFIDISVCDLLAKSFCRKNFCTLKNSQVARMIPEVKFQQIDSLYWNFVCFQCCRLELNMHEMSVNSFILKYTSVVNHFRAAIKKLASSLTQMKKMSEENKSERMNCTLKPQAMAIDRKSLLHVSESTEHSNEVGKGWLALWNWVIACYVGPTKEELGK